MAITESVTGVGKYFKRAESKSKLPYRSGIKNRRNGTAILLTNFELLRKDRPILADLGRFAEQYAYSDPSSALVKLRSLAEQLTKAIYWELRLEKPIDTDFVSHLTARSFRQAIPEVICSKIPYITNSIS